MPLSSHNKLKYVFLLIFRRKLWTFLFYDNCIINGKCMSFFVFSILQKISTGYPIFKFDVPLKICTKRRQSDWYEHCSRTHSIQIDPEYILLTSFHALNSWISSLEPSSLALHSVSASSSSSHRLSSSVSHLNSESNLTQYGILYFLLSESQFFIISSIVISAI